MRWLRAHREGLEDGPVAFAVTVIELALLVDGSPGVTVLGVLLTLVSGSLLVWRRRAPEAVLAATALLTLVLVLTSDHPGGAPVIVALFTVAERRDRWVSLGLLVPTAVLLQAGSVSSVPTSVVAWALGVALRARRRERERDDQLVVQEERAAVARELHDVVAHSVTVMLLGVRGARDVLRSDPGVADEVLRQVEASGERSVTELRRVLDVLRAPGEEAPTRPAPALSEVPELVAGYRAAGVPVTLEQPDALPDLPAGTQLSVYRIIEEALTNVLKHARPQAVRVRLAVISGVLTVTVEDDSAPARPAPPGHGITGMRERVSAAGGTFSAGALPAGGFRVEATLPVSGAA